MGYEDVAQRPNELATELFAPHVYISDFCLLVRSNGALLSYL